MLTTSFLGRISIQDVILRLGTLPLHYKGRKLNAKLKIFESTNPV